MPNAKAQAAPDFIPAAAPDFIPYAPAGGGQGSSPTPPPGVTVVNPSYREVLGTDARGLGRLGSDTAQGIGESVLGTIANIGELGQKILPTAVLKTNYGQDLGAGTDYLHQVATPDNTPQSVFKDVGNAGQFFVPGEAEETAVTRLGALAPALRPLIRPIVGGISAGLVNKAEGGGFLPGLLTGTGTGAFNEFTRYLAPGVAEDALGITKEARRFGRRPGVAALEETSGLSPAAIHASATEKLGNLENLRQSMIANAPGETSLLPARQTLLGHMQEYASGNAPRSIERIRPIYQMLTEQGEPAGGFPEGVVPRRAAAAPVLPTRRIGFGQTPAAIQPTPAPPPPIPLPESVPHEEALALRRSVGNYSGESPWTGPRGTDPLKRGITQSYGALTRELQSNVPGLTDVDERTSALIPVKNRAGEMALGAPTSQRVLNRIGRPTGALIPAMAGARMGGVPGAITGLVAPEVLSSPTVKMAAARAMFSPAVGQTLRATVTPEVQRLLNYLSAQRAERAQNAMQ